MIRNEPVLAGITTLIGAVAAVLVAFGVHLTDVQIAALVELAQAAFGVALIIRHLVTPTTKLPLPPAPALRAPPG